MAWSDSGGAESNRTAWTAWTTCTSGACFTGGRLSVCAVEPRKRYSTTLPYLLTLSIRGSPTLTPYIISLLLPARRPALSSTHKELPDIDTCLLRRVDFYPQYSWIGNFTEQSRNNLCSLASSRLSCNSIFIPYTHSYSRQILASSFIVPKNS